MKTVKYGSRIKVRFYLILFIRLELDKILKSGNKAVRVALNPDFMAKAMSSEFVNQRKNGVEPKDIKPDIVNPLVEKITTLNDEDMLKIEQVKDFDFKPKKGTFEWEKCAKCGEVVFSNGLRVVDGKHYCIPCYEYL